MILTLSLGCIAVFATPIQASASSLIDGPLEGWTISQIIDIHSNELIEVNCNGCKFIQLTEDDNTIYLAGLESSDPPIEPTATLRPTNTPVPTPTPPPTATPIPNNEPRADAPQCDDANPEEHHFLWNAVLGCHYDHEHKYDPNTVNDIFGVPGCWFGNCGQEISYPWQTFAGASDGYEEWSGNPDDLENAAKHNNYGWIVRRNIPSNGRTIWIRAFRLQQHSTGAHPGTTTRFHSYSLEAEVCIQIPGMQEADCGIYRNGGWLDFGNLEVSGFGPVSLDADPTQDNPLLIQNLARRRIHFFYQDVETRAQNGKSEFFWYGQTTPFGGRAVDSPHFPSTISVSTGDAWSNTDPNNPTEQLFFCPEFNCEQNNSTIQAHVVSFGMPEQNADSNGILNQSGYVDRYGKEVFDCNEVGLDCIPYSYENVQAFSGRLEHRDDRDLGFPSAGNTEFDVSPDGVWWIRFPN